MTLNDLYNKIREFHIKHGAHVEVSLDAERTPNEVNTAAGDLESISALMLRCYDETESHVALRVHLITEELAEFVRAVEKGDRLGAIDAIGDLQYVVTGTAVTYDISDMDGILTEIHRSNMTKKASGDPRVRIKGEGYTPPNLKPFV